MKKTKQYIILFKTLKYFIPIFFLLFSITLTIVVSQEKAELKSIQNIENSIVNGKLENIQENILQVKNDLMILTLNSQMKELWSNKTNDKAINSLSEDFFNICKYRKLYDQVRLINKDGDEIIRINFNNNNPQIVPKEELQNKKNRYYLNNTFKLNKNDFFISPLDLNIEHGEIEQPIKPMMRIATPIVDEKGVKQGIVLLNYFGNTIINKLANNPNSTINRHIMLLNGDGYFIKAKCQEEEWGFMYPNKKHLTFANIYPEAWHKAENEKLTQFVTQQGMFTIKTIYPISKKQTYNTGSDQAYSPSKKEIEAEAYNWTVISYIPSEFLFANRNIRRKNTIFIFILLSLSLLFISWRLTKAKHTKTIAQQALIKNEENYSNFLNNLLDIAFETDNKGNLTYINRTNITNSDMPQKSMIGRSFLPLYAKKDIDKVNAIFKRILNGENLEYTLTHSDGRVYRYKTSPKRDSSEEIIGTFGIARDITERKKVEEKIQKQNTQLKELNATKDKFFSIIAHDLKSPFSAMISFSEILVAEFDTFDINRQKEYLGILNDEINNTYKLLENLLLWANTQRGSIEFNPENENLYLLTEETNKLLTQLAKNKSIKLINLITENVYIKADKNMVLTVLRNLISNAIKFTPEGGQIKISSHKIIKENKHNFIKITIKDSGVGISEKKISKLFTITKNISTKGTNNEAGTGLGLILCKEFVEKNNGKIWVESEVDNGSKFIFTLPTA